GPEVIRQNVAEGIAACVPSPVLSRDQHSFVDGAAVLVVSSAVDVAAELERVSAVDLGDVVEELKDRLVGENAVAHVTFPPTPRARITAVVKVPLIGNLRQEIAPILLAILEARDRGVLESHPGKLETEGGLAQFLGVLVVVGKREFLDVELKLVGERRINYSNQIDADR